MEKEKAAVQKTGEVLAKLRESLRAEPVRKLGVSLLHFVVGFLFSRSAGTANPNGARRCGLWGYIFPATCMLCSREAALVMRY